ncbi:hypothetical protein ACFQ9X_27945 [Catenulispora yoronensis]
MRLCGRLPLAVHLMASRLRHYPVWQTADLVADLAEANRRMTALSAEDVSVSAVFACSYRDLAPERQRLFRLLGLPPGDDIEPYAAAALSGVEPAQAWLALRDLEERHLVEEPVRGRYRMHDRCASTRGRWRPWTSWRPGSRRCGGCCTTTWPRRSRPTGCSRPAATPTVRGCWSGCRSTAGPGRRAAARRGGGSGLVHC